MQNEEDRQRKQKFKQQAHYYSEDLNRQKQEKQSAARLLKQKDKEFAAQEVAQ